MLLPPKRAQTLNYRGLVAPSGSGRFLMVQNATPATSITVVDLTEKKVAGEIQTPGCWGVLPSSSHPARFSMLCGDGKLATVTLDDKGLVVDRQLSDKLFDADHDAWFHTAERIGDRWDLTHLSEFVRKVNEARPDGRPRLLFASFDRHLRLMAKLLFY